MVPPSPDLVEWPLVGRGSELEFLVDAAAARAHGFVIAGDRGVGKTRLAAALVDRLVADGWKVSSHVATEARSSVPFAAFLSLLDSSSEAANPLQRLLGATQQLTEAEGAAALLHVEDAHWLDDESLAFVHHVAESTAVHVLMTVRTGHTRSAAVTGLGRSLGLERLHLQPLARLEVDRLLRLVRPQIHATQVHHLWELTHGNPLYLHEVVARSDEQGRSLELDGGALADIVDARLDDLDPASLAVLELLTVAGTASLAFLTRVSGQDAVVDLERRQLVTVAEAGRRLVATLAHPIYGEVVTARMGLAARRVRQRQLLDEVDGQGRRRQSDVVQAAVWATEHGDAIDPAALLAVAHLFSGFSHGEDLTSGTMVPPLKGGLLASAVRLAKAAVDGGGGFEAAASWFRMEAHVNGTAPATAEALSCMHELATTEEQQTLVMTSAAGLHLLNGWQTSPEVLEDLQRHRRDLDGTTARRRIDALMVLTMAMFGRNAEAIALGEQVLADPLTSAQDRLVVVGPVIGSLIWVGRSDEALRLADDAIAALPADADQWSLGALVFARIGALAMVGRLVDADELAAQFLLIAEATGNQIGTSLFGISKAQTALSRGRPEDALAAARSALGATSPNGPGPSDHAPAHAAAAHALAWLGRHDEAQAELELARSTPALTEVFAPAFVRAQAWVALSAGRHRAAVALLRDAVAAEVGGVPGVMTCLHELAALGELGISEMTGAALARGAGGDLWAAFHGRAVAIDADDGALLDASGEVLAGLGATLAAAEACALAAGAHGRAGARGDARDSRARSAALAAECQGATTPALTAGGDTAVRLTKRELEVARLAARGASDRDIADDLFIGVRTVESHLYRIYAKLGVSGRADLASHPEL